MLVLVEYLFRGIGEDNEPLTFGVQVERRLRQ